MLKEILKSFSGNMRERVSSPLLGWYTISVVAINWKPLVILFTSRNTGIKLIDEVLSVAPEVKITFGYSIGIAIMISIAYPTLKAIISVFNASARILEIRAEFRLEDVKEQLHIKQDPIENLIRHINEEDYFEKIGYHDLKRLLEYLPDEDSLLIKNKSDKNSWGNSE